MSRIGKAYEARFRSLLLRLHTRKLEKGVRILTEKAQWSKTLGMTSLMAWSDAYEHLRTQVRNWERHFHPRSREPMNTPPTFICDAGLGGLARWLRAAGYETLWFPDLDDAGLLRRAAELRSIVLTTDSLMMERGVLRDGIIPAFWIAPAMTIQDQLGLVFREFNLVRREPRCMHCGGELRRVPKESMRERIPPKTWRWIDDYFVCTRCDKLFWRGTHWQRIENDLAKQTSHQNV